jgi:hypothetical protein
MEPEDGLVMLTIKMIKYAHSHSFRGKTQDADLFGFCVLNNRYSRLEKKLDDSGRQLLADNWDVARNKLVTYVTQKVNNYPPNDNILAEAFLQVAEPYLLQFHEKIQLRKAL